MARPLATGFELLGSEVASVETGLLSAINAANEEILIAAYTVTDGSSVILDRLRISAEKEVRVDIIVNKLWSQSFTARSKLTSMAESCKHVRLYNLDLGEMADLHAKLVVVDRRLAIIGSSNLTARGLSNNIEIGLEIEGAPAEALGRVFDKLLALPEAVLYKPAPTFEDGSLDDFC